MNVKKKILITISILIIVIASLFLVFKFFPKDSGSEGEPHDVCTRERC